MKREILLGDRWVGEGHPAYIIAEIGINHNGDLDVAKQLIDASVVAGCDAVKFQKRTPELCVPLDQRDKMRHTPWGYITYMEYRERVEFGQDEFSEIADYCKKIISIGRHLPGMSLLLISWRNLTRSFIKRLLLH
jgi:N-acetylneuraminate synthase